jgi:hypothetical protein
VHIAFTPPAAWTIRESGLAPGTVVAFVGPVVDQFAVNFNLRTTAYEGGATLPRDLPQQLLPLLRRDLPTYKLTAGAPAKLKGADAFRIDGAFVAPATKLSIRNRQVFAVRNGRLYIFTFTATADSFDAHAGEFDKMIQSVTWTPARAVQGAPRQIP